MGELKERPEMTHIESNDENIFWVDKYISGTGNSKVYESSKLKELELFEIIKNRMGDSGGGLIEVTKTDLDTLISDSELKVGTTYKITGVHRAHTVNGIPVSALYDDGRDLGTTIFLKAVSKNRLESFGSGIFYNPKYDKQVQGFGIWSSDKTYNVDDIVFWGGYAWKNLNGNTGSSIDILNLDGEWEKLNYDDVNYNKVVDYIEYDIENDIITRRYDTVNNIDVSCGFYVFYYTYLHFWESLNPISLMQWGNDLYLDISGGTVGVGNISVKQTSFVELINFKGEFINNVTFDNGSYLYQVTFNNQSYLQNVTFDNGSYLYQVTFNNQSYLQNVTFNNQSYLQSVTFDNGSYLQVAAFDNGSNLNQVTFDNQSYLQNVTFDNKSRLPSVTFDNGSYLYQVTFDNNSNLQSVAFDNSNMRHSTFVDFIADFNLRTYNNLQFSNIKFEGNSVVYNMPDISIATIITDPNIPQKKVFGINNTTIKIQYWDTAQNDFVVADITD